MVIDRHVEILPAGVGAAVHPSWRMRFPTSQKRPSFLMSTCKSSPGRSRS